VESAGKIDGSMRRAESPREVPYGVEYSRKLERNKIASSTKQDVVMKFYGFPPIGQKQ
jgi:hypothetical protein